MSKKMPLDRYPYMDNDLKSISGDISNLDNRVTKIENDIYGDPIILHYDSENISELIEIDEVFAQYGEIDTADVCINGKNITLTISIKFNDYDAWVNNRGFEDPESKRYKQYNFNIGVLKKFKPRIFSSGGCSRYSSQIPTSGAIISRFIVPFYKQNSKDTISIGYHYISEDI